MLRGALNKFLKQEHEDYVYYQTTVSDYATECNQIFQINVRLPFVSGRHIIIHASFSSSSKRNKNTITPHSTMGVQVANKMKTDFLRFVTSVCLLDSRLFNGVTAKK